jgi:predicted NBD/HSP70 family sugar kinase
MWFRHRRCSSFSDNQADGFVTTPERSRCVTESACVLSLLDTADASSVFGRKKRTVMKIVVIGGIGLIGSGVGGCVVVGGLPYQGMSGSAGEWGHTTVAVGGRACRCGSHGCLEAYIGAQAILDRYREANPTAADELLARPGGTHAALQALVTAAQDDGAQRTIITESLTYLGAGLGNLINLLNPERIVVGGWAGLLIGRGRLDDIRAAARLHSMAPRSARLRSPSANWARTPWRWARRHSCWNAFSATHQRSPPPQASAHGNGALPRDPQQAEALHIPARQCTSPSCESGPAP